MHAEIRDKPALRAAGLRHVGPYTTINEAFGRLGEVAGRAGLFNHPGAVMLGIYHDDPRVTPADKLRSDAAVAVPNGVEIPKPLTEQHLRAGRYACAVHEGSYDGLPDTWSRLLEWIRAHNLRAAAGASYEVYLNDPTNTPADELRTEVCVPVE